MGEKVFKPKPRFSNCGYKLIEIIYGLSTKETIKKANKKKVVLGGCMIWDNHPEYYCKKCKKRYFKILEECEIKMMAIFMAL